jgi:prepilin-type N-terminal cleavage/methylation domain-containing protein
MIFNLKKGFTLIELLIVVAIIAILAAIAVPNFLEAQVRAKVAKTRADVRSCVTALESYRVDNNGYPPYGSFTFVGAPGEIVLTPATEPQMLEPMWITSPIAYISSGEALRDPFRPQIAESDPNFATERHNMFYNYVNWDDVRYRNNALVQERYGAWRFTASGPDGLFFNTTIDGGPFGIIPYNPTNGTTSVGDIIRTQKDVSLETSYI